VLPLPGVFALPLRPVSLPGARSLEQIATLLVAKQVASMDDKPHTLKKRFALRRALKARLRAYYKFLARQPVERFVILLRERQPVESREVPRD